MAGILATWKPINMLCKPKKERGKEREERRKMQSKRDRISRRKEDKEGERRESRKEGRVKLSGVGKWNI